MARPKSGDKRKAILDAAAKLFAERGPGVAPTADISRLAGIAEGTLFTYFKTKDDLADALYRQTRQELAAAMMADFPRKKKIRRRMRSLWNGYVRWGMANPVQHRLLAQLAGSNTLTGEARRVGEEPFVEVRTMAEEGIEQGVIRAGTAAELIVRVFGTLAATVAEFVLSHPTGAEETMDSGFKLFWTGITRKGKTHPKD